MSVCMSARVYMYMVGIKLHHINKPGMWLEIIQNSICYFKEAVGHLQSYICIGSFRYM